MRYCLKNIDIYTIENLMTGRRSMLANKGSSKYPGELRYLINNIDHRLSINRLGEKPVCTGAVRITYVLRLDIRRDVYDGNASSTSFSRRYPFPCGTCKKNHFR
jgi:hypothetical protein